MSVARGQQRPTVSVLIVSWNAWDELRCCLESLRRGSRAADEIVVVENASSDGTLDNLREHFPEVRVYASATNLGHTGGFNLGMTLVRGDYVLLLDADTEVAPDVVEGLADFMEGHPEVAICAPRLYHTDGAIQGSARRFPSVITGLFGRQSLITRLFPDNPISRRYLMRDHYADTEPYQVEALSSACMFFRRTLVDEVGLWDERYPGYWVDIDWCFQIHALGRAAYCIPALSVIHHDNYHFAKRQSPRRIWMFHYGAYLLYRKHYTTGNLDPRALLALAGLGARAGLVLARELLRR